MAAPRGGDRQAAVAAALPVGDVQSLCPRLVHILLRDPSEGENSPVNLFEDGHKTAGIHCSQSEMLEFTAHLDDQRKVVDAALERYLPPPDRPNGRIEGCMRYSVEGGKRLRPILLMMVARLLGSEVRRSLPTACAVELIHTHSLILDDLPCMDDDDFRRGRPSSHHHFGESTALLAADALLNLAIAILGRNHVDAGLEPTVALEIIREVGEAVGTSGVIGAQLAELVAPEENWNAGTIEHLHLGKTASLFRLSARAGAFVAGKDGFELVALTRYSEILGLAFQVMDDLIDAEADRGNGGHGVDNRVNYALSSSLEQARQRIYDLTRQALQALSAFDEAARPLRLLAIYNIGRSL